MGLILDSSVVIAAERKGQTVAQLLAKVFAAAGIGKRRFPRLGTWDRAGQHAAGPTRREAFIQELLADVPVYPFTRQIAFLAGRVDGEQQSKGVKIPFQDLLIGATALYLNYSVMTGNPRHFLMIPGLVVQQL